MFNRLSLLLCWTSNKVKTLVQGRLAHFKRYHRAGLKAYQAARNFLVLPSEDNVFEPLTPVILEPERSSRYEQELWHGLKNPQVRNIALTGEYGAGKSSVIRTFVDRHPEFIYAFVSLATFGKDTSEVDDDEVNANGGGESSSNANDLIRTEKMVGDQTIDLDLLTRIEETIVQQLLYAVPAKTLPKTRLKRITQASTFSIWLKTFGYGALILAALRLYLPTVEKLPNIDPAWLLEGLLLMPVALAVSVAAIGGIYFLHAGLRLVSLFSIDGLTLKGGKLESTHHGSVLHKNIDEIIYCFERSTIDVVVIEDLDRFGIHDVFTRLREINFIIKQSPQIKRPVYFVYALRDEMFVVGEKTKFFDLIIPVIPVINSENSREKMYESLNRRSFKGKPLGSDLHTVLVETVCYYIDDMRVIKNIVNEFDIFSSILATSLSLDPNKLFAIVAIRNLHPGAYAKLVKRKGPIYKALQDFQGWKELQVQQYKDQVEDLQRQRQEHIHEVASSVCELRSYVWLELLKRAGASSATHVQLGGDYYTIIDFITDEVFNKIFSQNVKIQTAVFESNYGRYFQKSESVNNQELLSSTFYKKRYAALQRSVGQVNIDIAALQKRSNQITRISFRSAAKGDYGEVIRQILKGYDVVSYLIRAGYFETDYTDYFGYFYEGSLTPDDKNLILDVRRGISPGVTTNIDNPHAFLEKLEGEDLDGGRGIIADFINYLCNRPYRHAASHLEVGKLAIILRSGCDGHIDRMAEATQELLQRSNLAHFIKAVFDLEPRLFRQLFEAASLFEPAGIRQSFICAIFNNLSATDIKLLAQDEQASLYPVVAALEDVSLLIPGLEADEGGWAWLRARSVAFGRLGNSAALADLKKLISWGCIEVNLIMLTLICAKAESENELGAVKLKRVNSGVVSFRRLKALSIEGLEELLLESPELFITELLDQAGMLDESAESLAQLLSALHKYQELAEQLFDCTECHLNRLEDAPPTIWGKVLEADRVSAKVEAAWTFFDEVITSSKTADNKQVVGVEDESIFAEFIARNVRELQGKLWRLNSSDASLQRYLITSSDVSMETLMPLLAGVVLEDVSVLSGTLPSDRWPVFASSAFLPYSSEVRNAVVTQCAPLEGLYLASRWVEARCEIDLSQLTLKTVITLSKHNALSLEEKVQMWSSIVLENIVSNLDALETLARVCSAANQQAVRFSDPFIQVLRVLVTEPELTSDQRTEILIQCLPSMSWPDASNLLGQLSEIGFRKLGPKSRKMEVSNNDLNLRLVNALKSRDFLSTVTPLGDVIRATSKPRGMV
ncbi:hypothetical protein [Pseudomonas sp.]|uniref:YobI family P-loop NTPase n=1 Tax=Pseudomonas sp. TaxID=306 RepID=UPI0027314402|nr:hypothetical protein [Pseudomonas sp.]MDP2243198.1 hypothetical protein [Pseudomonas sp.]